MWASLGIADPKETADTRGVLIQTLLQEPAPGALKKDGAGGIIGESPLSCAVMEVGELML